MAKKITKKLVKTTNARTGKNIKAITVKNADGEPDTTAEILIQNKISYTPKVSVIIPVYNVENYLHQCLDSVCNQTLKEIEIICVDDGSTDSSLDILKEYAKKDNRITVIAQESLHAGVARNAGLSVAKGEYLLFLDSDDFFELRMLEDMYKNSKKSVDIVVCNADIFDNQTSEHRKNPWLLSSALNGYFLSSDIDNIFSKLSTNCWNKLFRKDFIIENNIRFQNLISCNDVYFVFAALALSKDVFVTQTEYVHYRINTGKQITTNNGKTPYNILHALNAVKGLLIKTNNRNKINKLYECSVNHFIYAIKRSTNFKFSDLIENFTSFYEDSHEIYISKIKHNVTIPIVLATNDGFSPFVATTILSIMDKSSTNYFYKFFVFSSGLTKKSEQNILTASRFDNMEITFCNVVPFIKNITVNNMLEHVTEETYYRMFIPDILSDFNKCLYLDSDLIVTNDIVKLFDINLGNNYIAAARNFVNNSVPYIESLNLDPDKYFNAGVLVLNLTKWRQLSLRKQCIDLIKSGYKYLFNDQDILNIVCKNNVLFIPITWNYMWQFEFDGKLKEKDKILYKQAENKFSIIHYSSHRKPWNIPTAKNAFLWWKYALDTKLFTYEQYLKTWYKNVKGQDLNISDPKTYNEKLQWLKIYDATPLKTTLADKVAVRDWVADKIGEEYLIPIYGVYDSFDEIDFDKLPDRFVIKTNHGSGWNIIVPDKSKLDLADAKEKMDRWMSKNFALHAGCELHYGNIKPKILIEEYIDPSESDHEIQIWCFSGKMKFVSVESIKDTKDLVRGTFYLDGTPTEFVISPNHYKKLDKITDKSAFNKAIELAKKMLIDVPYVRIDFIEWHGSVRFREMTFTSGSGLSVIEPKKFNRVLGDWIQLPRPAYNIDTGEYYKLKKIKPQILKEKREIKPYLLFPYYILASMFMRFARIPSLKLKKHSKFFLYSRSHRGKTDMLNKKFNKVIQSVNSVKNDITNQILQIKNQQNNLTKQIAKLKDETKANIQSVRQDIEHTNNCISDTKKSVERDQVLYFNPTAIATLSELGMCDMTSAPNFEERFKKLMAGLPAESAETVVKIIRKLQQIKGAKSKLDIFTTTEQEQLRKLRDLSKEILKVSDNLYAYKNYMLPANHFEPSVFVYNHGISQLNSVDTFKDKDILDIGGFIGDSVLMLAPLTTGKVHSFEATNENYNHMLKTIELNGIKNAVPVHTAVGDKPGEIELRFSGSASSQNDIMVKNPKYVEKCPVITIDDYVREHNLNVGLIKVDIEGAEQSFLRGAYETIRTQKPTLLISIYHNIDDFLDIKPMIDSWNLGYKFKIFKPTIESVISETLLICEQ